MEKPSFETLFEPIKIGDIELSNRLAMAPMDMLFSTHDGFVTEQSIAWYTRRAKGGFGLIITEAIFATKMSYQFNFYKNFCLYNDLYTSSLNTLVEAVHSFGAKIFAQLTIGLGRQGRSLDGTPAYAPSPIPYEVSAEMLPETLKPMLGSPELEKYMKGRTPREMTVEEIQSEQERYVEACLRAITAGFDGIEIHAPHGYLLHQFLSPRSNKRTDQYGGSLENRMRFLVEIAERTLEKVKNVIPVGVRMSAAEHMPGGLTLDEVKAVAKKLEDMGISYFNISDGCYEALKYFLPESIEHVKNHILKEAAELKSVLDIPIMTPSINDPALAEQAVREGITDIVELGRQSIADPDWPNKVKQGKTDEIRKCTRCLQCLMRMMSGLQPRCAVNPEVGFERYDQTLFPKRRKGAVLPDSLVKWSLAQIMQVSK
ncbi:MAG: NADH:flavin oxidoreductase [Candidatus Freyarchaeota archaeon]|nr:NADH:flavin oxidoreductase [Candidatus Jordarchaeia archaeon]MBS7268123.1 NADH:flavin oxidoreductase [Candidatus Jordarchaeia archaeon]MBS7278974.1 NADH:flavin oxidoreductase [Candidatus Jordarchaeia archaeon]